MKKAPENMFFSKNRSLAASINAKMGKRTLIMLASSALLITLSGYAMTSMTSLADAAPSSEPASSRVTQFKLDNGLDVLVIPDHRAPVVTHMMWYRVGAADEPHGTSRHRPFSRTFNVQGHQQNTLW